MFSQVSVSLSTWGGYVRGGVSRGGGVSDGVGMSMGEYPRGWVRMSKGRVYAQGEGTHPPTDIVPARGYPLLDMEPGIPIPSATDT